MENPERPNKAHIWAWIVAIVAFAFLASVLTYLFTDKIDNLFKPETVKQKQTVNVDTIDTYAVPTIQEILDTRKHIKEYKRIDSVFLTMPDVILIDILLQHGTSLSNSDIVTIYESNRERYNNVMSGARVQQYKDSLDKYNNTKDTAFVQRE